MKIVHVYDIETGAYIEDRLFYPIYEGVVNGDGEVIGLNEIYKDIPENSTELPLPQPNWKPVFQDGKWVETITQEELDELNKPKPQEPTELEKLRDQVEFLAKQVADLELGKTE